MDIKNFINGEYVTNADGRTFEKRTPIDNSLIGLVHEAGQPEVDAAVGAARAALRRALGPALGDRAGEPAGSGGRRDQPPVRRLPGSRGRRHRQAAHPGLARGHPARGGQLQDLHRHHQERLHRVVRDVHTGWQDRAQLRDPGAARRDRRGLPVEPAAAADDLEGRARAGLRQHRGGQAVGGDAEHRDPARRGDEHRRRAGRRLQRGARLRPRLGRRLPDRPPGGRRHHLHRRDPHRHGDHEGRRRRHPAGLPGAGRQERGRGLRRLRLRRRRGHHHALGFRELRPGLPGHRAGLRRASDLRPVRGRAEDEGRGR